MARGSPPPTSPLPRARRAALAQRAAVQQGASASAAGSARASCAARASGSGPDSRARGLGFATALGAALPGNFRAVLAGLAAALAGLALGLASAVALGFGLATAERLAAISGGLAVARLLLAGARSARMLAFLMGFFDFWGMPPLPSRSATTNTVRDRNTVHKCLAFLTLLQRLGCAG